MTTETETKQKPATNQHPVTTTQTCTQDTPEKRLADLLRFNDSPAFGKTR